ncbi:HTH-type transcriptional repressor KstR2 [compost metagenome]
MAEAARPCPPMLMQAAQELIAESGYTAMTMRQLAARVGLLPGSLYHHISCKQDLLLSVLLDVVDQRVSAWEKLEGSRNLTTYVRFLLGRQCSHPAEELLLRHETRYLDDPHRSWFDKAFCKLTQPLKLIIQQGQKAGKFRVLDVQCASEAILAVIEAADRMRTRLSNVDEAWIENQVMQMCQALLAEPGQPYGKLAS